MVADEVTAAAGKGERWSAAVYGADRPGLVACELGVEVSMHSNEADIL